VAKGGCIGLEGDPQEPSLVGCDHPEAWKLLAGPPIKKPQKPAPQPEPEAESKPASTASPTAAAGAKQANPCRALSQMACAAKSDVCAWKADKNKCGKAD
jgi:hypothetical protein